MVLLRKNNRGFTLLETTMALAVIVLFLVIPLGNCQQFESDLNKATFFKSFKSNWNHALLLSKINEKNIQVHFDQTNQEIKYKAIGIDWNKTLKVPHGLYLESVKDIKISREGFTKPETIAFTDLNKHKKIIFTIQMQWGEMLNGE